MATITKRGNNYRIRVSVGYDANGKQIIKQMSWKPTAGLSEKQIAKEVNKVAVNFEQDVLNGYGTHTEEIKFSSFLPTYYEMMEKTLSPNTMVFYKVVLERDIIPQLGHMKITDIKPIHIQKLIQYLSSATRENGKKLSPATVKRYLTVMKSVMSKAYKLDLIERNPTESSKLEIPQSELPDVEIFTEEEIRHLLQCLQGEELSFQVLVHLAMVTGCRRGELVALKWSSIDMDNCILSVLESSYKLKGEDVATKPPKTKSSIRKIIMPSYINGLLRAYKEEQTVNRSRLKSQWEDGDWVFTQWNGKGMNPHTPTKQFSQFLARHDIPHRKFHALRHTSATILLENGTSIKTVSARLGHTQLSTTNRYVHATHKSDSKAAQVFDFFGGNK